MLLSTRINLAIGANVGTTITAILDSMSANEAGKRLAAAHLLFNVITGIIAIALIYQLATVVVARELLENDRGLLPEDSGLLARNNKPITRRLQGGR